jgi:glucan-binding YG repeat protein
MHKKIKVIIATTLILGAVSGIIPANDFTLGVAKAYAATYKSASNGELSSLSITRPDGNEIELRESYSGDEVSLSGEKEYYIELTGEEGINLTADAKGSGYVVKMFTSAGKTAKGYDVGSYIKVNSTYTNVYLRTYESEAAYKDAYDGGDVTDCKETYTIHISSDSKADDSDEEENKEYAYLRSIYLSDGDIDFTKTKYTYDVNVGENVKEIVVRAKPDDEDYSVDINDSSVEEDNDYEKTVALEKGDNTIKIKVESNDQEKTYTLNVYRGAKATTSTSTGSTAAGTTSGAQTFKIETETNKNNVWKRFDGKWKYVDGTGQILKNQWWFDKNNGMNYYLDKDGFRTTGWYKDLSNNSWYYFNENGEMQTGWVCVDKNYYFLNKSGVMKMGWLEDASGNYYYLDGSTGAMKTGWLEDSDGNWYYLDSTGKMIKDSVVNNYQLDKNGVLIS